MGRMDSAPAPIRETPEERKKRIDEKNLNTKRQAIKSAARLVAVEIASIKSFGNGKQQFDNNKEHNEAQAMAIEIEKEINEIIMPILVPRGSDNDKFFKNNKLTVEERRELVNVRDLFLMAMPDINLPVNEIGAQLKPALENIYENYFNRIKTIIAKVEKVA